MKVINRARMFLRRRAAGRPFGVAFTGVRNLQLPPSIQINGKTIPLSFPCDHTLAHEMVSIWLDDEYGLNTLTTAPRKVVDIGANVGLFTLKLKNCYPDTIVHGYEPDQESACHFKHNTANLDAVTFFEEGASDLPGSAEIVRSDSTRLARTRRVEGSSSAIKLTGLDEVMHRIGGDVDLLKIDCEGAEWDIMKHRSAIREASKIRMEYHLWVGKEISDFKKIVSDIGFEITHLTQHQKIGFAYLERC